jgi:hypothetical protein
MGKIHLLDGDFGKGHCRIEKDHILFLESGKRIPLSQVDSIEPLDNKAGTRAKDAARWIGSRLIGGTLLGPLGYVAGSIIADRGGSSTVLVTFRDGRKCLGRGKTRDLCRLSVS